MTRGRGTCRSGTSNELARRCAAFRFRLSRSQTAALLRLRLSSSPTRSRGCNGCFDYLSIEEHQTRRSQRAAHASSCPRSHFRETAVTYQARRGVQGGACPVTDSRAAAAAAGTWLMPKAVRPRAGGGPRLSDRRARLSPAERADPKMRRPSPELRFPATGGTTTTFKLDWTVSWGTGAGAGGGSSWPAAHPHLPTVSSGWLLQSTVFGHLTRLSHCDYCRPNR